MPLHRYKFESNSQHCIDKSDEYKGCLCHYIDTSLKAIHNDAERGHQAERDVYAIT